MKTCARCNKDKRLSEFRKKGGLYTACCVDCLDSMKEHNRKKRGLPRVGEMITSPCENCGEPMDRVRKGSMPRYCLRKECKRDRDRKADRRASVKKRNDMGWKCSITCPYWRHCKLVINTLEPVVCQQELTHEQRRVLDGENLFYGVSV